MTYAAIAMSPPCVFFDWWFSPRLVHIVVPSGGGAATPPPPWLPRRAAQPPARPHGWSARGGGAANPFSSLGTFSSSFIGDLVLHTVDDYEHPLRY